MLSLLLLFNTHSEELQHLTNFAKTLKDRRGFSFGREVETIIELQLAVLR